MEGNYLALKAISLFRKFILMAQKKHMKLKITQMYMNIMMVIQKVEYILN